MYLKKRFTKKSIDLVSSVDKFLIFDYLSKQPDVNKPL